MLAINYSAAMFRVSGDGTDGAGPQLGWLRSAVQRETYEAAAQYSKAQRASITGGLQLQRLCDRALPMAVLAATPGLSFTEELLLSVGQPQEVI